eukprot:2186496-Heterocapsa_arctica.AAC.1
MADDRARAEGLERARRATVAGIAGGAPRPPDWDPAQPWSTAFRLMASDADFWNAQVRYPAATWLARGGRGVPLAPEERVAAQ